MPKYISLNEMAEILGCSAKKLNQIAKEKSIPFVAIGNRKRFDPAVVEKMLTVIEEPPAERFVQFYPTVRRSRKPVKNAVTEALGL